MLGPLTEKKRFTAVVVLMHLLLAEPRLGIASNYNAVLQRECY